MNRKETFARRTANWLVRQSRTVLPEKRSEWAAAMSGELHYISSDYAALHWALGFLLASCLERVRAMNTESFLLPRWLLSLEMLLCFVPLTFLAAVLIIVSLNGAMPVQSALLSLSAAAIGPIGLVIAFRMIVLRRMLLARSTVLLLCVLAAWTILAFSLLGLAGGGPIAEWWRELFLMALLPAVGTGHLILVGSYSTHRVALS